MAHMQADCGGGKNRTKTPQTRMDAGSTVVVYQGWQPIGTAPKDGTHFLALVGGLPYEARFDELGRFIRFIHTNVAPGAVWKIHQHDGREMREQHLQPEEPRYVPTGMIWQNGFGFEPTHWSRLPAAPKQEGA